MANSQQKWKKENQTPEEIVRNGVNMLMMYRRFKKKTNNDE